MLTSISLFILFGVVGLVRSRSENWLSAEEYLGLFSKGYMYRKREEM